jgi:hypothetical protein
MWRRFTVIAFPDVSNEYIAYICKGLQGPLLRLLDPWRPLKINQPTNSMEQSLSWEANRSSASQEIHRILWNPKFCYRI